MALEYQTLLAEALNLPEAERIRLIESLEDSLSDAPGLGDGEFQLDPEWKAEIERRLAKFDAGESESIPAEEFFSSVRRRLLSTGSWKSPSPTSGVGQTSGKRRLKQR